MIYPENISDVKSILLLGANNMLALPVIRAIGTKLPNVKIHTLSYRDGEQVIPDLSRYVHTRHYIAPVNHSEELLPILTEKIKETQAEILLPIDENDIEKVIGIQERLKKYVHLPPLPSGDLFNSVVFKDKLTDLLKEHNLAHPITYKADETEINTLDDSFFPCLLKPVRGSAGNGIEKINSSDHLKKVLKVKNPEKYIIQEIIPGKKFICNLLAEDGEIYAINIQEGLESRNFSFSTTIKFVENKAVSDAVYKLVKETGYSGLANIDFRLDERDGHPKAFDFNPRFWSSLSGSQAAGLDFTLLTCLAALGQLMNPPGEMSTLNGSIFHMGKSSLKYFFKRVRHPFSDLKSKVTNTDLRERISDPLPEIVRLLGQSKNGRNTKPFL